MYTLPKESISGTFTNLRFNCPNNCNVTISNLKNGIEYDLYTLTLDAGDTVMDGYTYPLNPFDSVRIKSDITGITYTANAIQV